MRSVTSLRQLPTPVRRKMIVNGLVRDLDEGIDEGLVRYRCKRNGILFDDLIYFVIPFLKRFD